MYSATIKADSPIPDINPANKNTKVSIKNFFIVTDLILATV